MAYTDTAATNESIAFLLTWFLRALATLQVCLARPRERGAGTPVSRPEHVHLTKQRGAPDLVQEQVGALDALRKLGQILRHQTKQRQAHERDSQGQPWPRILRHLRAIGE